MGLDHFDIEILVQSLRNFFRQLRQEVAGAINAANFTNVVAYVNAANKVVIEHKTGGDMRIKDTGGLLTSMGYIGLLGDSSNSATATPNLYRAPDTDSDGWSVSVDGWIASNWKPLEYTASNTEPLALKHQASVGIIQQLMM